MYSEKALHLTYGSQMHGRLNHTTFRIPAQHLLFYIPSNLHSFHALPHLWKDPLPNSHADCNSPLCPAGAAVALLSAEPGTGCVPWLSPSLQGRCQTPPLPVQEAMHARKPHHSAFLIPSALNPEGKNHDGFSELALGKIANCFKRHLQRKGSREFI